MDMGSPKENSKMTQAEFKEVIVARYWITAEKSGYTRPVMNDDCWTHHNIQIEKSFVRMTSVLDLLISAYIKLDIQVEIAKGEEGF
jgi:hypothetical protein